MSEQVATDIIARTYARHRRVALVASFQAESGVLIDLVTRQGIRPDVLTIDTGRLPAATHDAIADFERHFGITVRVITPDPDEVRRMVTRHGSELFRESVELRGTCCDIRKVRPLQRALRGYDAWLTGIRRDQAPNRADTPMVSVDHANGGIAKVAPLAGWSRADVDAYIDAHAVPRHPLYAQGYTSIGCAPCTRPTSFGEDERAGRWWWEHESSAKECGLHALVPRRAT